MGGMGKRRIKVKIEHAEDRFFKMVKGSKGFPQCHGKYPDCPSEALALQGKNFEKKDIPRDCQLCPFFEW